MAATASHKLPVEPKVTHWNPSADQLREWALQMPNAKKTSFGAPNVQTRVLSRSKANTFVVSDTPEKHSDQTISVAEGREWAAKQNEYIKGQEMVVIDGYIGNDKQFRVPARLIIEKANANIAGMQKQLYYPATAEELKTWVPTLTVIYTPNLKAEGKMNDRLIACYLDQGITRVFFSDYFGESKKGGLRMWNKLVYDKGGLPMHAGAKIIPVGNKKRVALIVGLSGTGKTTTTFTNQNGSQPVQDDFLALMPGGRVYASENGCFAKTYGLNQEFEPAIYYAVNQKEAYLENVSQNSEGKVDYFDESYTQNGRSTFTMDKVAGYADASEIEKADILLILNKNENIIPAVAKLDASQAAAYFMLGETQGTAAGGAAEAGRFLRVPGTNPFYPGLHAEQGNRLLELLKKNPLEVYLLNTGRVGGPDGTPGSKKVKIPHSSAVVKGIAEGTIVWERDPDFGYEVAKHVPGVGANDIDVLQPRLLYKDAGRMAEYDAIVENLKKQRVEYMAKWKGLDPAVAKAVG